MKGHLAPGAIGLLLVTTILAGCASGGTDAPASTNDDPLAPVEWNAETGAIAGKLIDSSLLPVPRAAVVLEDTAHATTTSDSGSFGFSFVHPGTYSLSASAAGFDRVTTQVRVNAGEVTEVQVETTSIAGNVSYHETMTASGRIGCSVAVWQPTDVVAHNQPVGLCVPLNTGFQTVFLIDSIEDVSGFWIETTWESTQIAGDGFTTFWPFGNESGLSYIGVFNGSDPLSDPVPPATFDAFLAEDDRSRLMCEETGCRLAGWHYTYANTLGNAYPVDFAIQVDQPYDDFVTVFHGEAFPSQFTALPDA